MCHRKVLNKETAGCTGQQDSTPLTGLSMALCRLSGQTFLSFWQRNRYGWQTVEEKQKSLFLNITLRSEDHRTSLKDAVQRVIGLCGVFCQSSPGPLVAQREQPTALMVLLSGRFNFKILAAAQTLAVLAHKHWVQTPAGPSMPWMMTPSGSRQASYELLNVKILLQKQIGFRESPRAYFRALWILACFSFYCQLSICPANVLHYAAR